MKMESHNHLGEAKQKYEEEIRTLQSKNKELAEQVYELETQAKDEEQKALLDRQEWKNNE